MLEHFVTVEHLINPSAGASVRSNTDIDDQVCLRVGVPAHPTGVGRSWDQGSVQTSPVLPHHTGKTISLWT